MEIILTCFELCTTYEASYGLKTAQNTLRVLLRTLLSFSRKIVFMARLVRPHLDNWTRALHAGEGTGSDEFAKN